MTTSTKRIKVYGDTNARLSPAALASLGADSWITHGHVHVVATSKREAEQIMEMHGCYVGHNGLHLAGKVDPEHGDTLDVDGEALREAGLLAADRVGACYASGVQGAGRDRVADLTADGTPVIGHLASLRPDAWTRERKFVPTDATERLRAAIELLTPHVEDGTQTPHRDALRLVLDTARKSLPIEES
jgi:hypothetical protein